MVKLSEKQYPEDKFHKSDNLSEFNAEVNENLTVLVLFSLEHESMLYRAI